VPGRCALQADRSTLQGGKAGFCGAVPHLAWFAQTPLYTILN
jgi:hypothetical protein